MILNLKTFATKFNQIWGKMQAKQLHFSKKTYENKFSLRKIGIF